MYRVSNSCYEFSEYEVKDVMWSGCIWMTIALPSSSLSSWLRVTVSPETIRHTSSNKFHVIIDYSAWETIFISSPQRFTQRCFYSPCCRWFLGLLFTLSPDVVQDQHGQIHHSKHNISCTHSTLISTDSGTLKDPVWKNGSSWSKMC